VPTLDVDAAALTEFQRGKTETVVKDETRRLGPNFECLLLCRLPASRPTVLHLRVAVGKRGAVRWG
jgi:hypothetical protein